MHSAARHQTIAPKRQSFDKSTWLREAALSEGPAPESRGELALRCAEPLVGHIAVRCFGLFEVSRAGEPVRDWRRDKAKVLLKQLVVNRGANHRDVLLDRLWPELDHESAVRNLRVTVHALRRALEGESSTSREQPLVLTHSDAYELNPAAGVWVDTESFRSLLRTGLALERQGLSAQALTVYQAAEALYRDDYLVDDLYAEWTQLPREALKDDYLLILTRLADAALAARDLEACIAYCHKILARDPSREDAYQGLMRCHARAGRRARALRWYELCRLMLGQELSVAPSDTTRRLAECIGAGGVDCLQGSLGPLGVSLAYA
jgi:DNA-binding SARP family transcriptional activator